VAVELFRALKKRDRNRYSYRLVIGPEYYSGAAFLSKAEGVERIKGGVYLDMLGVDTPLGASLSFNGDTYMDKAAKNAIAAVDDKAFFVPYRELWGNDELFYDGPDFHIPMVCVGRKSFSYYHTDKDDIGNCDMTGLDSAYDALDRFINILENDYVPVRKYKGPLYLSKYDLSADFKTERGLSLDLDKMQILMDGDRSCLRIADDLGVEFELVYDFAKKLQQLGLVEGKECEPFHE
jgi:aminopeptidase-like protein